VAPNDRPPSKPLPKDKEKRRRELERLKYQRQAQQRAQSVARARKRAAVVAGVAVVVAAIAGGTYAVAGGGKKKAAPAAAANPSASAPAAAKAAGSVHLAGCSAPAAGSPGSKQWKTEPAMSITTTATYTATLNTDCGPITIKLDAKNAPHTVNSFVFLAGQHFFDHVVCHRLTTGGLNVLQCGDPTGSGSGGPGYTIPDENLTDPALKGNVYPAGTVAMANTGQAHTGGSQFFLVYADSQLPPQYTPFGTITGGLDMLKKIGAAGSDNKNGQGDGAPLQSVVMNTVTTSQN
jgi:peptidyl-prolyl cis-trans isomerase B (cyclophilin B)